MAVKKKIPSTPQKNNVLSTEKDVTVIEEHASDTGVHEVKEVIHEEKVQTNSSVQPGVGGSYKEIGNGVRVKV